MKVATANFMPEATRAVAKSRAQTLFETLYRDRATWDGEAEPKKHTAAARRMATSLEGTVRDFERLLSPDEADTLHKAAEILRSLGGDLQQVCQLARGAKLARERKDLQDRNAAADAVAGQRWPDDEAMLSEAADLATFIDQHDASMARTWVQGRHSGCRYIHFPDGMPTGRRLIDMLNPDMNAHQPDRVALRRRAAEYVVGLQDGQREAPRQHKDIWAVGTDDYEAWRAWRAEIKAAITPAKAR